MTPSHSFVTSNLIWAVPPGRPYSSLEKFIKPFDPFVWICFFVVLFIAFLVIGALSFKAPHFEGFVYGPNVHSPSLNVLNLTLGGSLTRLPTRNFARYILIVFIFYSFIMQNSYQGALFKFMQMSLCEKELSTTDELVKNDFKFYMLKPSTAFFKEMPKVEERIVVVDPDRYEETFDRVIDPDFKGAVLSTKDHLAYRNILIAPKRFYHHAEEVIMTRNIVIYMTKQSSLAYEIDETILYLMNGGFINIWISMIINDDFLKNKMSVKIFPLTVNHLIGAFQILISGLIVSVLLFMVELLSRASQKLISRVFAYLRMAFSQL
jgi:hypothetical protein